MKIFDKFNNFKEFCILSDLDYNQLKQENNELTSITFSLLNRSTPDDIEMVMGFDSDMCYCHLDYYYNMIKVDNISYISQSNFDSFRQKAELDFKTDERLLERFPIKNKEIPKIKDEVSQFEKPDDSVLFKERSVQEYVKASNEILDKLESDQNHILYDIEQHNRMVKQTSKIPAFEVHQKDNSLKHGIHGVIFEDVEFGDSSSMGGINSINDDKFPVSDLKVEIPKQKENFVEKLKSAFNGSSDKPSKLISLSSTKQEKTKIKALPIKLAKRNN